ncbi:MAG: hypothetical protein PHU25_20055 [Deltaproteobacteria bacterium]|nr:hypothetical protein [Deltaproteobacteria bacterium]
MPLPFESKSHGTIAFGFFNIESDMLLLENAFFFATDFCAAIARMVGAGRDEPVSVSWPGYRIASRADVGDLTGAIHGERFEGFIGEVYRRFPFPAEPDDFKQKPEGEGTRAEVEAIMQRFGRPAEISAVADLSMRDVTIADVVFPVRGFHQLLRYVWRGGYPRWKGDLRPACVTAMRSAVEGGIGRLFEGIVFD